MARARRLLRPQPADNDPPQRERLLTDTLTFMRLFWALDHRLASLSKRMQARIGITGPQRLALRMIGRFPGTSPSELAELLHIDRGTCSGILRRLVAAKLVARSGHPTDGRRVILLLTARGRQINRDMAGTVELGMRRALASVTPSQTHAARTVLDALTRELARQ